MVVSQPAGHRRRGLSETTVGVLLPCGVLLSTIGSVLTVSKASGLGRFLYNKMCGTLIPGTTVTCKHSSFCLGD